MTKTKKLLLLLIMPVMIVFGATGTYYYIKQTGPYYLPDITLKTYDGQSVALNSLRGKPVLVVFWASTCSTCIRDLPRLIALHDEYADQGLEMVGIVIYYNDPDEAYAMVQEQGIPYRILLDKNKQATYAFRNVHYTPTTFLVAPSGRIVYRHYGKINFELISEQTQKWLAASR